MTPLKLGARGRKLTTGAEPDVPHGGGEDREETEVSISEVMTSELPKIGPADSIGTAARAMSERGVKAIPVCDGERLVGIVTDWDVTRAVAEVATAGAASDRRVEECMSTDLVTAPPTATFGEATAMMSERQLHHLLISDEDRFVGMVHLDVDWSEISGVAEPIATFTAPI
jgi:CBS domain-containing protein